MCALSSSTSKIDDVVCPCQVSMLSKAWVLQAVAKMCPSCGMAIEKTMGCNKMTCSNCHKHFCYKCNMAVQDYDHFRDGSCRLFDELEITRWQYEWDAQVEVER